MSKLDENLIVKLQSLESGLSGMGKNIIKQYILFCNYVLHSGDQKNKCLFRPHSSLALALQSKDTTEVYLFTELLKSTESEVGISNRKHPLFVICENLNIGASFSFNETEYRIIRKSRPAKQINTNKKVEVLENGKNLVKKKKTFGIVYKESKEEKRERIRNYLSPIYNPMGLGKRR